MYTECIVSHLLTLFFYAAKKPELHSNKLVSQASPFTKRGRGFLKALCEGAGLRDYVQTTFAKSFIPGL